MRIFCAHNHLICILRGERALSFKDNKNPRRRLLNWVVSALKHETLITCLHQIETEKCNCASLPGIFHRNFQMDLSPVSGINGELNEVGKAIFECREKISRSCFYQPQKDQKKTDQQMKQF